MSRAALIEDGIVVNVIEYDPDADWTPPEGTTVAVLTDGDPVGPGWTVKGKGYEAPVVAPPAPTVPSTQEQLDALVATLVAKDAITEADVDEIKAEK